MMQWLFWAAIGAAVLFVGSTLAIWAFGRFARRAAGPPSQALPPNGPQTELDREAVAYTQDLAEDESTFALLSANTDAFAARAVTARRAGRSLDLMYYIWQDDLTGRLLLGEILAAAERGVRVRLLIDDIGVGLQDSLFLAVNAHPKIEVRLFNPTRARSLGLRRGIEMVLRFRSVNRRMHNKAWIADGQVVILGGRNIADSYFGAAEQSNFRDLDVMLLGKVVSQSAEMFDEYWNSPLALPLKSLAFLGASKGQRAKLRAALQGLSASEEAAPYLRFLHDSGSLLAASGSGFMRCTSAELLADPPEKALGKRGNNWIMQRIVPLMEAARQRVQIVSPYFVPGREGTEAMARIAASGVEFSVLTNSLAATDVAAVHGGYAPRRRALLQAGVVLYELKPLSKKRLSFRGSRNASLHTKAFLIDEDVGFVGSLNFDPRSASLNTEMGVLVCSPVLASALEALFLEETDAASAYRLALDEGGRVIWHDREGEGAVLRREPESTWARRFVARLVSYLPLQSQL